MVSKKIITVTVITLIAALSLSGCVIDKWEDDFQKFQKNTRTQLENMAQEKADQIKKDMQDRIDKKIDEIADGVKDSVSIMGENGISATTETSEMPKGIELGGTE